MATVRYFIFANLLSLIAGAQITETIELPDLVEEASGVIITPDDFLYIINDSGNEPRLFEFTFPELSYQGSYYIDVRNRDWETITQDRMGNVYICDIGDNQNQYYHKTIYKFPRRALNHQFDTIYPTEYVVNFPENPRLDHQLDFDWESAVWYRNQLHHFSKNRRKPFDGKLLSFSWNPMESDSVNRIDSTVISGISREFNWITDATLSPDGRHLFLLSSNRIFAFLDFPESDFFKGYPMELPLSGIRQREGICFSSDEELVVVSEDHPVLGEGKLELVDLHSFYTEYAKMRKTEVRLDSVVMDSTLSFQVESITDCEVYYELYTDEGQIVKRGNLGQVYAEMPQNLSIQTDDLPPGHYMLNVLTGRNPHGFFVRKYATGPINPSDTAR